MKDRSFDRLISLRESMVKVAIATTRFLGACIEPSGINKINPCLSLILFCMLGPGLEAIRANEDWKEVRNDSGGLITQSHDPQLSLSLLGILDNLEAQIRSTYGLDPSPNTQLIVRVVNWNYQTTENPPLLVSWMSGSNLNLQVTVQNKPKDGSENIFRTVIAAFLYQCVYQDGSRYVSGDRLTQLPLWVVEGLLQSLLDRRATIAQKIADRARLIEKTPTLIQVMNWKELSEDKIERAWQQAFCYQAFQFAFADPDRWKRCEAWLRASQQSADRKDLPWSVDSRMEDSWIRFQEKRFTTNDAIFFSWNQTAAQLDSLQAVILSIGKDKRPTLIPLSELAAYRDTPGFGVAVTNKLSELIALELRANFAWRPVIEHYRLALDFLLKGKPRSTAEKDRKIPGSLEASESSRLVSQTYREYLQDSERMKKHLVEFDRQEEDYLNWFEVTQRTPMEKSSFEDAFQLLERLDAESSGITDF